MEALDLLRRIPLQRVHDGGVLGGIVHGERGEVDPPPRVFG